MVKTLIILIILACLVTPSVHAGEDTLWWRTSNIIHCLGTQTIAADWWVTILDYTDGDLNIHLVLDRLWVGYAVTEIRWKGELYAVYHNSTPIAVKHGGWVGRVNSIYQEHIDECGGRRGNG